MKSGDIPAVLLVCRCLLDMQDIPEKCNHREMNVLNNQRQLSEYPSVQLWESTAVFSDLTDRPAYVILKGEIRLVTNGVTFQTI